jgi:hypothetical protein
MVVQLDPKFRERIVLNTIEKYDMIGFNGLFEKLRVSKNSMAKSTLKKVVDVLIENNMIAKIQGKGKQNYSLTTNDYALKKEKNTRKKMAQMLLDAEKKFKRLQKLTETVTLYQADSITLINSFIHSIWFLDWQFFTMFKTSEKGNLDEVLQRLNKLKKDIFEFAFFQDLMGKAVTSQVSYYLQKDTEGHRETFTLDLEDFEGDLKYG